LLIYHPVTTQTENSGTQITNILKAIIKLKKITLAIVPNSDAGNKEIFDKLIFCSKKYKFFQLYRTIPRSDYLGMLKNCGVLVGNSSSGIIEASYFGTPVVNIGIRQKGREKGKNVVDVPAEKPAYIQSEISKALRRKKSTKIKVQIYGKGNASKKIVNMLEKIKLDKELIQKQIIY